MHIIWSVIAAAVCIYLLLVVYLFFFQARFMYAPDREITATPAETGLEYEDVIIRASDGLKLSGWFIPAERPRATILFCHGNAGNISDRLESIRVFNRLNLNIFIFDYRGYGRSEGKPSEKGTYLDSEAAYRFLTEDKQIKNDDIIIFGRSLGGAVAAYLARKYNPGSLILEGTFTSALDIAKDIYPYLPVKIISRYNYNTEDYLNRTKCPVLIIHSSEDRMIPLTHGQRLFESANEPKEFLEITGTHNSGFMTTGKRYDDCLDTFISKYNDTQ